MIICINARDVYVVLSSVTVHSHVCCCLMMAWYELKYVGERVAVCMYPKLVYLTCDMVVTVYHLAILHM